MASPAPVVICGKSAEVFTSVQKHLAPEFEGSSSPAAPTRAQLSNLAVIHSILSVQAGVKEIPILLAGGTLLSPPATFLGTGNYSRPPVAVIMGAGFDDAAFAEMREASLGVSSVPWIRPDVAVTEADGVDPRGDPDYPAYIAGRAKKCLLELADAGQIGQDAVVFY